METVVCTVADAVAAALRLAATFTREALWRGLPLGTAYLAAFVFAATVAAQAQPSQSPPDRRVIVIGEGSVTLPPDRAQVRSGVTTTAKTAKEATEANSRLMAAVNAAVLNAGVEQKDIQTTRFSLHPVYVRQQNTEPKLSGFSVSNQVEVTIRQIANVGEILDRLVTAGATEAGSVEFLHSDTSKPLDQAREAAMADAKRKAELYARAAGLSLGSVNWITEDSGYAPSPPMALRAADGVSAPVPISAGEDTLQVRVTVGFDLVH